MIPHLPRLVLALALGAVVSVARAQPSPVRLVVEPEDGDMQAAEQRLRAALRARGVVPGAAEPSAQPGFDPARLVVLEGVEAHLASARRARARLEDAAALRELLAARRLLESDLALPGLSRWLAEVELQLGLLAVQMGREPLALQSFARAASLDAERELAAAEAPPATLALWQRAAGALRQESPGRFRVESDEPASVWLDDRRLGRTPRRLEVTPGRHLLRLQAPGHLPYAALIDVLPGERPALRVALSPDPAVVPPAPRPGPAESPQAFGARVREFSLRHAGAELWWLRASTAPGQGPSLWRCSAGECVLEAQLAVRPAPSAPAGADEAAPRRRMRRIAPWVAVAVALVAGAAVAATVRRPEVPASEQVVTLDSGDLLP